MGLLKKKNSKSYCCFSEGTYSVLNIPPYFKNDFLCSVCVDWLDVLMLLVLTIIQTPNEYVCIASDGDGTLGLYSSWQRETVAQSPRPLQTSAANQQHWHATVMLMSTTPVWSDQTVMIATREICMFTVGKMTYLMDILSFLGHFKCIQRMNFLDSLFIMIHRGDYKV